MWDGGFAGGRPVMCYEMRELVPGIPDPRVFEVPHSARRSGPLQGFGLLSPANAVKGAAGLGVAGASSLVGWLFESKSALALMIIPDVQKPH